MGSFYRPDLPSAAQGSSRVRYERDSPGFNAYYKWYQEQNGKGPNLRGNKLYAPAGWQPPSDWTYSEQTGHWYSPQEMTDAGYNRVEGEWLHRNDLKRREVERKNAELDARIARRKATEERFRGIRSRGRKETILTSAEGAGGAAEVIKRKLSGVKGVMK